MQASLNPKTVELVYRCEECGKEYDLEWLLTLERSEEGFFKCSCCYDAKGDEILTHTVFEVKVKE